MFLYSGKASFPPLEAMWKLVFVTLDLVSVASDSISLLSKFFKQYLAMFK